MCIFTSSFTGCVPSFSMMVKLFRFPGLLSQMSPSFISWTPFMQTYNTEEVDIDKSISEPKTYNSRLSLGRLSGVFGQSCKEPGILSTLSLSTGVFNLYSLTSPNSRPSGLSYESKNVSFSYPHLVATSWMKSRITVEAGRFMLNLLWISVLVKSRMMHRTRGSSLAFVV